MAEKRTNPIPIRFPDEVTARLRLVAAKQGVPKNRIVVDLVKNFLEQIESDQATA